jgi:hypothetical protein
MVVLSMSRDLIEEYRSTIRNTPTIYNASRVQSDATRRSSSYHPTSPMSGMGAEVPSSTSNRKLSNDKRSYRRSRLPTEEADALSPAPASSIVPAHQRPSSTHASYSGRSFLDALKSSKPSLLTRMHDRREKENVIREASAAGNLLPSMPLSMSRPSTPAVAATNHAPRDHRLTIVSGPSFTLDTGLVMTLCGELISYNLESLEDDPKAIINLLKITSSERDKWMVVACHYRRKGKFEAAILVVTSMVEGKFLVVNQTFTPLTFDRPAK